MKQEGKFQTLKEKGMTEGKNKAREEAKRMRTINENEKGKSRSEEFEGRKRKSCL